MPAARAVCGIVLKDQKLLQGFGESKPCEVDHGFVREANALLDQCHGRSINSLVVLVSLNTNMPWLSQLEVTTPQTAAFYNDWFRGHLSSSTVVARVDQCVARQPTKIDPAQLQVRTT